MKMLFDSEFLCSLKNQFIDKNVNEFLNELFLSVFFQKFL